MFYFQKWDNEHLITKPHPNPFDRSTSSRLRTGFPLKMGRKGVAYVSGLFCYLYRLFTPISTFPLRVERYIFAPNLGGRIRVGASKMHFPIIYLNFCICCSGIVIRGSIHESRATNHDSYSPFLLLFASHNWRLF